MGGVVDRFAVREGRVGRALVAFMALGFAALLAAGVVATWATGKAAEYTGWVNHTYDVRVAIRTAEALIERVETARRGYLLSGEDRFLVIYDQAQGASAPAIASLGRLTADNARQRQRVAVLRGLLAALDRRRGETIALMRQGRRDEARVNFAAEADAARMRRVRAVLAEMAADEVNLLRGREADQASVTLIFYALLAAAGLVLLLVAAAAVLTVVRYTRDLAASRDQLGKLNDTLERQVLERTADLTLANEEIQRFAYIVSHDLRSPLVNVMGFTAELSTATDTIRELLDRAEAEAPAIVTEDARLAAREDLPEAIGFIRTSTAKMDRLINAILKLSREGRRTLAPEPLDLAAMADTIVASIRRLVDERGVVVTVERPMPRVVSDRLAVEQILSNLVENATKYLQPGRPGEVTISAREERGRILVEVADNGRGIDPRDHQRIFDLFRRSGAQDQPGEGIGLAHVRALAYRLGGTITVSSNLGEGATFRLSLPVTPPKQEPVQ